MAGVIAMLHELRQAGRALASGQEFFWTALGALALVTTAATVTFAILNTVWWRPLPYPEPEGLMAVETFAPSRQAGAEAAASGPDFRDLRAGARLITLEAVSPEWSVTLQEPDRAERVAALFASPGLFGTLGARALHGRLLTEADEESRERVVVLGHAFWRRRYHGEASVVGRTLRIDGREASVVGVMAPLFRLHGTGLPGEPDLWIALAQNFASTYRPVRFLKMLGRLKPGATLESAQSEVAALERGLAEQYPDVDQGYTTRLRPLNDAVFGESRAALLLLSGFVVLLLVIACANIANLMLARGLARQRETAVRLALGATPAQVARVWLAEGILLGLSGAVAGAGVAWLLLRGASAWIPAKLPRHEEIGLDFETLLFAAVIAVLTAVAGALMPAPQLLRTDLRSALAQGGRAGIGGAGRIRALLMAAEVALATVLLVGAGLLGRTFIELGHVDPGFRAADLLALSISLPPESTRAEKTTLLDEVKRAVLAVPGVTGMAAASRLPLMGQQLQVWVEVEGRPVAPTQRPEVSHRLVTTNYMSVMGVPLKRGRLLDERDNENPLEALLVNEAMARRVFPGEDPIGKRIRVPSGGGWVEIVGVVGDMRHLGLDVAPQAELYRPDRVNPLSTMMLAVRAPAAAASGVRAAIRQVNPGIPIFNETTMEAALERSLEPRRFPLLLGGIFAAIALALALAGLHGVLSQWVMERRAELAVRMALGATRRSVAALVLRGALRMTMVGLAGGLAVSALLGGFMRTLVYGVSPFDPWVYASVPPVLLAAVLLAGGWPAWRASRVEPLEALRQS